MPGLSSRAAAEPGAFFLGGGPGAGAKIGFERGARFQRRPAAHLAKQALVRKIVKVAVDGHLRDRKELRQAAKRGGPLAGQHLDDAMAADFGLHRGLSASE